MLHIKYFTFLLAWARAQILRILALLGRALPFHTLGEKLIWAEPAFIQDKAYIVCTMKQKLRFRMTSYNAFAAVLLILMASCATAQSGGGAGGTADDTKKVSLSMDAEDSAQGGDESAISPARKSMVVEAQKYVGTPYRMGGMGPSSFDCSGFVFFVARQAAGVQLPRTSQAMKDRAQHIEEGALLPGDLVFFKTVAPGKVSHVGIYIGSLKFIHAASDGPQTGVIVSSLMDKYWKAHYDCAGRIIAD